MSQKQIDNKTTEETWTKYVPPNKRKNKSNKSNNKDKSNVDLFNPDMFPTLNPNEENANNIKQDCKLNNYKELFNNDDLDNDSINEKEEDKNMLILTRETIKKYKEEKNKLQDIYENDLNQINERATKYITEILNRENERRAVLDDLYGEGYFEHYIPEEFPYYSTTDSEEENNSLSSFDDDEYFDEQF